MDHSELTEQLKDGYAHWLSEYRWDWFATLKADRGRPSRRRAAELFDQWVKHLQRREGGRHFRWVRVMEHGANGDNDHFHVLVGGSRSRHRFYERQWSKHAGSALIRRFDPTLPGIEYMLKTMDHERRPWRSAYELPISEQRSGSPTRRRGVAGGRRPAQRTLPIGFSRFVR